VFLDVITRDPNWFEWSARALEESAENSDLVINAAGFLAGKCFMASSLHGELLAGALSV